MVRVRVLVVVPVVVVVGSAGGWTGLVMEGTPGSVVSVSVTGQTVVVTGMVTTVVVLPPLGQSGTSGAHEVMVRMLVV
jgi:hypothetical protein